MSSLYPRSAKGHGGQHMVCERDGQEGKINVSKFADFAVLSGDYDAVPEGDIPHLCLVLTILGGKVVSGEGDYAPLAPALPRPMLDWSPVATLGGGCHRAPEATAKLANACGCASACTIHGHDHVAALGRVVPVADAQSFWSSFGCGCWAV